MLFQSHKIILVLLYWLIFLSGADKSVSPNAGVHDPFSETASISESKDSKGYRDIVLFKDKVIAVGTDGRIDCMSKSGKKIFVDSSCAYNLHCAFSNGEILIAAGDHGTILYSSDGKSFHRAESGTEKNIHGIASKNGLLVAGADRGTLLSSKNGVSWNRIQTALKGNIVSLSANNSFFIAVSDSGEIMKSIDGTVWKIQDYNKEYAGYNKHSTFKKVLAAQNGIVIMGITDDGLPSILFSTLGTVWTERIPIYQDNQGVVTCLTSTPNGITYDSDRDQFILACDHGELLSLPPCSKCNKYAKISETDLHGIIYFDNRLLIAGDGYSVFIQRFQ
jgi:hypothetical protein